MLKAICIILTVFSNGDATQQQKEFVDLDECRRWTNQQSFMFINSNERSKNYFCVNATEIMIASE